MKSKLLSQGISIFLTVDSQTIEEYFNAHDPAPLYKRHLSHKFEQYIMSSVIASKRYSTIKYKFIYKTAIDEQYTEPLILAIRTHFAEKKRLKEMEFEKFKKRGWALLVVSMVVMMVFKGVESLLKSNGLEMQSTLNNGMDIFSWVILWRPIDVLIFNWNPYLKEICLLDKLKNAEVIRIQNEN
ncbi:MAG TPA: hypothetical protein VK543_15660 [Puia sp.]|nr:hypothetical protein [Puia sp.]